jgi:hypothetical protein
MARARAKDGTGSDAEQAKDGLQLHEPRVRGERVEWEIEDNWPEK